MQSTKPFDIRSISTQNSLHPSTVSSRFKPQQRPTKPLVGFSIVHQRNRLKVIENGQDVTPRALMHPDFPPIEEPRTVFDTGATGQFTPNLGSSVLGSARFSSLFSYAGNDDNVSRVTNFFSITTRCSEPSGETAMSPPIVHPPEACQALDPDTKITIILKETETIFLFGLPQITVDATSPEGLAVKRENERYATIRGGVGRKCMDAETQTPATVVKAQSTLIEKEARNNRGTLVNKWVMYDDLAAEEERKSQKSKTHFKSSPNKNQLDSEADNTVLDNNAKSKIEDAARVIMRVLASSEYGQAQKRFAGLVKEDATDLSLELTYKIETLWIHFFEDIGHRPVNSMKSCPSDNSLLAVGYGAPVDLDSRNNIRSAAGIALIWNAKNPKEPDRIYEFSSSVSDLDWSKTKPNLMAIGFYNGMIKVIDISKKEIMIIRESTRKNSPSYDPHWQVQWWIGADQLNPGEQIYTSNHDGRVMRYTPDEDFKAHEILRIRRLEIDLPGMQQALSSNCPVSDVPISRHPAAFVLKQHPTIPGHYLIGTDEGVILKCSVNYTHHHLSAHRAHFGPIHSIEHSPFIPQIYVTCGAGRTAKIWVDGINDEPILELPVTWNAVSRIHDVTWSPRNSTIIVGIVDAEVSVWELKRKRPRPASVTNISRDGSLLLQVKFSKAGDQVVTADNLGYVTVLNLTGIPQPPIDQEKALVKAIEKRLTTRPHLLKRLKSLGHPFDQWLDNNT